MARLQRAAARAEAEAGRAREAGGRAQGLAEELEQRGAQLDDLRARYQEQALKLTTALAAAASAAVASAERSQAAAFATGQQQQQQQPQVSAIQSPTRAASSQSLAPLTRSISPLRAPSTAPQHGRRGTASSATLSASASAMAAQQPVYTPRKAPLPDAVRTVHRLPPVRAQSPPPIPPHQARSQSPRGVTRAQSPGAIARPLSPFAPAASAWSQSRASGTGSWLGLGLGLGGAGPLELDDLPSAMTSTLSPSSSAHRHELQGNGSLLRGALGGDRPNSDGSQSPKLPSQKENFNSHQLGKENNNSGMAHIQRPLSFGVQVAQSHGGLTSTALTSILVSASPPPSGSSSIVSAKPPAIAVESKANELDDLDLDMELDLEL